MTITLYQFGTFESSICRSVDCQQENEDSSIEKIAIDSVNTGFVYEINDFQLKYGGDFDRLLMEEDTKSGEYSLICDNIECIPSCPCFIIFKYLTFDESINVLPLMEIIFANVWRMK